MLPTRIRTLVAALLVASCTHRADAKGGQKESLTQGPATLPASTVDEGIGEPGAKRKRSSLGTNLDSITDWSSSYPFVDAMKRSREWGSTDGESWEDQRPLARDEDGWVKQLGAKQYARTLVFWGVPTMPKGDYVVTYQGDATFDYLGASAVERKPGRELIRGDGGPNMALQIMSIPKLGAYPHPIRVLMPGGACANDNKLYCDGETKCAGGAKCVPFEQNPEQQLFHPKWLQTIAPYSAVRFMDWMATNLSKERLWKDRPKPTDVRWRDGVPVEIMVALANRLKVDPWFNMPHAADDEYVTKFATYVRDNLDPQLKSYVEYSNEVWNGMFPQAAYAGEQGEKLGLGKAWEGHYRFHSKRSTEMHKIWEKVYAGKMNRLVRVLGTQVANFGVAEGLLGYGDTKDHVDALAVAPYFGGEYLSQEEASKWENASVDEWLKDIRARSIPRVMEWVKAHAELAKKHHIDLIAYEGGESFAGGGGTEDNPKLNEKADAVGRDPRMKQVYLEYLEAWKKAGGHLFMHFTDCASPSKYGRWGAREYTDQPRAQAPKADALLTFMEKNGRWW